MILCILLVFSEEDGSTIGKSIDQLKSLEQRISFKDAQSLGDISIELNQLSSGLRVIQMGNTYMQSLGTSLLATTALYFRTSIKLEDALEDLVESRGSNLDEGLIPRIGSESGHSNDYPSIQCDPWFPLVEQFSHIQSELEQLKDRCEQRKFDMECLQKQIDINLNVVSPHKQRRLWKHISSSG